MTTRCVPDNNQYYKDNIINSNRTTTRSWPVICRQPKPYEDDDYETVFALNNNHLTNSNDDLSAITCPRYFGHPDSNTLQRTISGSRNGNNNTLNNQTTLNKMQAPTSSSLMGMTICSNPPPVVFLMITLLMTISATAMLCVAVMTDHWEIIRWDRDAVQAKITNNTHNRLQWFLGGRVAKISKCIFLEYFVIFFFTLCKSLHRIN